MKWFRSCLSSRPQFINANGSTSEHHVLQFGVSQGSVLGPHLYSLYTSPLNDIAIRHHLSFHFNADDTQLKGSGQKVPTDILGFFNLCSKVVDFWHVAQHYCIC